MYGAGIALLVLLIFMPEGKGQIGEPVNGAKSWYHTPMGNIQPSEFMKTFYILALARLISKHHEFYSLRSLKTDFILLAKIAVTLIVPLALIMQQPDLGSALVFFCHYSCDYYCSRYILENNFANPFWRSCRWWYTFMDGDLYAGFFRENIRL